MRLSLLGMFANVALAAIKLLSGLLGHSYALVADAVESMADILGSLVVWSGLRIAAQPPDQNHPYGHGKAEALAALIVSCMLIVAGLGIAVAAIHEVFAPRHAPKAFTLWVLVGVVIVKEIFFRAGNRLAKKSESAAVLADAWHHRSDAITSAAAAIGISIALIGGPGYEPADDFAALFASLIILYNGFKLARTPLRELMDADVSGEVIDKVRAIAGQVPRVMDVEKIRARKSGTEYWIDMHVEVDPHMSVEEAHDVSHRVKDAVRSAMPNVRDVLVHIEPHARPGTGPH
jgi:cation diffusion facilitator family transporter